MLRGLMERMTGGARIYPSGYSGILRFLERKRTPFTNAAEYLPPVDTDLGALRSIVVDAGQEPAETYPKGHFGHKYCDLRAEFVGQSELALLHAVTIAQLRRDDFAPEARVLFLRIWREQGDWLSKELGVRWLISAATTFGDRGETVEQRQGGMGLSILFDLIKLHDSERRLSGRRNDNPFPRVKGRTRHDLAFDMVGYSFRNGDLDRNMLGRLWELGEADDALRPLAVRMLWMVMTDMRSIFGRLRRFRPNGK